MEKRLREKLVERYYPEEKELEETLEKYKEISKFIEEKFGLKTHFAGSAARKTCIKGDKDIDIFVLFPEDTSRKKLEEKGLTVGKSVFKQFEGEYKVEYAEHPYTKGRINGHEVEIVPCYNVSPQNIQSSVDRTPHHSKWVEDNLSERQRKDVVILKTFLRSADLYGSSLKTQGFSGYLCEILVSYFGGFENLVESACEWEDGEMIDPENHHEGSLSEDLRQKFSDEPLRVIDPVDPQRNVASVLSRENFSKFIYRCWRFKQSPGIDFFEERDVELDKFALKQEIEKRSDFLVLSFERPEGVEDVIYPQLRKTVDRIASILRNNQFRIYESGFFVDEETRIFFELDRELPEIEEKKGPKVFHGEEHLEQFTSKYSNVYVKNDRLTAKVEREFKDAKDLLKNFLSENLSERGIPDRVAEEMSKYSFENPLDGCEKWLKYLSEKLHVKSNE